MENETVSEWLGSKGLSNTDIDFIETILTFTSTAIVLESKTEDINKKFQATFPEKKAKIMPDLTYQQFEEILQDNGLSVNLSELLKRFSSQGICVELCEKLLRKQDDN
ncbi:hypothetical protein NSA56_16090 [Oceanobacillus caeni]|uniref:Uncharacterized protein n=2 Tax=Bacteria TaxID=2 RepID=A0ABR5MIS5_9BACI|nr:MULTISPECIES: hypothetical protein [Bacillaceae]KKE78686.1 hypothetical protein WH51_11295 [Bacilli bacterium VT-13-104]PZD83733.1 hypothetical protein DEJ64_13925 [Bacilli bacterium]KPH74487.1 hypothetical protein AFL42_10200 [Oceanobacillus caeni]MBG9543905.1 hypothetical protein [Cytobacillus firmus]MBG9548424.1 hypothetical protein [Cytobacillus firmus]